MARAVYVANPDSNTVSVIDATTGTVSHTISVGTPGTLALTPDGQRLWVGQNSSRHRDRAQHGHDAVVGDISLGGEGRSRVTFTPADWHAFTARLRRGDADPS
jgi:YVTN family beta-propeller protein